MVNYGYQPAQASWLNPGGAPGVAAPDATQAQPMAPALPGMQAQQQGVTNLLANKQRVDAVKRQAQFRQAAQPGGLLDFSTWSGLLGGSQQGLPTAGQIPTELLSYYLGQNENPNLGALQEEMQRRQQDAMFRQFPWVYGGMSGSAGGSDGAGGDGGSAGDGGDGGGSE